MEYNIYNIFFGTSNIANRQATVSSSSKEKAESVLEQHLLSKLTFLVIQQLMIHL